MAEYTTTRVFLWRPHLGTHHRPTTSDRCWQIPGHAKFGRTRAKSGRRFRAKCGRFRACLGQIWPTIGLSLVDLGPNLSVPGSVRFWYDSPQYICRNRTEFGRVQAKLADVGQRRPKFGHRWPDFGRNRPVSAPTSVKFDRRPASGDFDFDRLWPDLRDFRPAFL